MKKITRFGVLGFMVATFVVAGAGVSVGIARAESNFWPKYKNFRPLPAEKIRVEDKITPGNNLIPDEGGGMTSSGRGAGDSTGISGSRTEIEAALKAGNARCATLTNEDQKRICVKQNEDGIRVKLEAINKGKIMPDGSRRNENGDSDTMFRGEFRSDSDQSKSGPQDLLENFAKRFERAIQNLGAVHDRILKLAERIESRMKKLSSENIDVSAGLKFTASAREHLRMAKASMEAARVSFKTEITATADRTDKKANTIYGGKTMWGAKMFMICKANNGVISESDPMRCALDGTTYVNADQPTASANQIKPTDTSETDGSSVTSATNETGNIRATLTKTMENIRLAKGHLKEAHQNLVRAIVSFKPGINKEGKNLINGETETNPSASTDVNSNN